MSIFVNLRQSLLDSPNKFKLQYKVKYFLDTSQNRLRYSVIPWTIIAFIFLILIYRTNWNRIGHTLRDVDGQVWVHCDETDTPFGRPYQLKQLEMKWIEKN